MAVRKNITWKTPTGKTPARANTPRPFVADAPVRWAAPGELDSYLVPGALFRAEHNLGVDDGDVARWIPAVHQYVCPAWIDASIIRAGAVCVYAGTTRVEEIRNTTITRLHRHTIISGSGRYIITNLNWISPVK
jgi:hypothetical protein